jgi:outer membrane protein
MMTRALIIFMAALFSTTVLAAEPPAKPAAAPAAAAIPSPILVVDVKRVLDESKASVSVQKQMEARRSAFQSEIAEKEKDIRTQEQELVQMRGKTEESAYAEKENQLRQKFRDVEKYVQDRRQLLEQATTSSLGRVRSVLLQIVTDIARKRGAHTVLVKQQVLWSEDALDITDQVLESLNRQLPDVQVAVEPADASPAKPAKPVKP